MPILVLLLVAIVFRIGFDVAISRTGGKIDDWLANGLLAAVEGIVALIIFGIIRGSHKSTLPTTKSGLAYSILAGIFVLIFTVLLIKIYADGENLAYVTPAVYGGTIIGSSLVGWLVYKDAITPLGLIGVLVTALGVGLVLISKA